MSDSYVTSQATLKCSFGDCTCELTVYPDRTVFLNGKPMANMSDHVSMYNIHPFGKCHTTNYPPTGSATAANHGCLTPMPCVPGTVSEWQNGKADYIVKGNPALLKSSFCKCQWGGVVTIIDEGQVDTGKPDSSKLSKDTEEQIKKEQEENEKLKVEDVLEGIQAALDVAGLIPGVGAIPDLLNTAIYCVRGDSVNAGLSLLAAVPGIGDAAGAAKLIGRGVKIAKNTKKAEASTKVIQKGRNITKESYDAEQLRRVRAQKAGIDPDAPYNSEKLYNSAIPSNGNNRYHFIKATDNQPIKPITKVEKVGTGKKGTDQYASEAKDAQEIMKRRKSSQEQYKEPLFNIEKQKPNPDAGGNLDILG